jgi:hypothetical protein
MCQFTLIASELAIISLIKGCICLHDNLQHSGFEVSRAFKHLGICAPAYIGKQGIYAQFDPGLSPHCHSE